MNVHFKIYKLMNLLKWQKMKEKEILLKIYYITHNKKKKNYL